MTTKEFKRRLVAVLSADVVGYSRLMVDDEEATVRTITAYRELVVSKIQEFGGRVVDARGDNLLAEFGSVVEAVRCAMEVQTGLKARNSALPEHRRMEFRIGINLGDVIENGETIYGDGVNIAARLESLAEPGGICLSRSAHDQVEGRPGLSFQYLGQRMVKNIDRPVRAYRVVMEPQEKPLRTNRVKRRREKPSIAVLPFDNLSGDPSQEYFSDGMTEEIISGLAKIPELAVIAGNSTFTYKGRPVKVQEVGQELNVRYVLEGSVRKSGNRVRITAQLIEAETGHHLWAERWDREMEDVFALQDEITLKVMTATQVKLTEGEQARIWEEKDRPKSLEVYELLLQGEGYFSHFKREKNLIARQIFEKAAALDPEFAGAVVLQAWTYVLDMWMGWSENPAEVFDRATDLAQRALSLNDSLDSTQALMGMILLYQRQFDQALAAAKKAVSLSPSGADAHAWLAGIQNSCGLHKEALESIKQAIRLNPLPPGWYFLQLGWINCFNGNFDRAEEMIKRAQELLPESGPIYFNLVVSHSLAGNIEEARAAAEELLNWYPNFSLDQALETMPFKDPQDLALIREAFGRVGLK